MLSSIIGGLNLAEVGEVGDKFIVFVI